MDVTEHGELGIQVLHAWQGILVPEHGVILSTQLRAHPLVVKSFCIAGLPSGVSVACVSCGCEILHKELSCFQPLIITWEQVAVPVLLGVPATCTLPSGCAIFGGAVIIGIALLTLIFGNSTF